jgi:hypothetical protein
MSRTYHTVCIFDTVALAWFDQFGSYKKAEANAEAMEYRDTCGAGMVKIISHADTAAAMIAARDALEVPKRYRKD